jgi:putative ubiquitin-RnfH superfamily antitoxin RatB of RatAB toxin-antitoxin module
MASPETGICVQVCYAKPGSCILEDLTVPAGATVHDAIRQSGILERLAEIDLTVCRVGIHGKLKSLDTVLRDRDRVEIYRPLLADPKESRRKRAMKKGKTIPD